MKMAERVKEVETCVSKNLEARVEATFQQYSDTLASINARHASIETAQRTQSAGIQTLTNEAKQQNEINTRFQLTLAGIGNAVLSLAGR